MAFTINRRAALAGAASLAAFPAAAQDKKVIIGTWGGDYSKLLTKNIGISFYGLELTSDRGSVLYNDIEDMETLDAMGEDYSVRDARTRRNETHEEGDPCFTLRHYYSPQKQRTDSAYLAGCSSTHGVDRFADI